jgi:hypothetical protein
MDYKAEVVLQRGRTIHAVTQKWLGRAGKLFGNWECPVCQITLGKTYSVYNACGPPPRCPFHNVELVYEEYALEYEGMTMHPDGLIPDGSGFILLEIKTQAHSGVGTSGWPGWVELTEPMEHHVEQANIYACVVPHTLGFEITKGLLWYISADRPRWQPKTFEFDPDPTRLDKHVHTLREIQKLDLTAAAPEGICGESLDPFCPVVGVCPSPPTQMLEMRA